MSMQGMFKEVKLVARGTKVSVTGDFDPGNREIRKAKVLFMVVQGDGGPDTVILEGEADWKRAAGSANKKVPWSVQMVNRGVFAHAGRKGTAKLKPDAKHPVRGIAHAIAFRPAKSGSVFEPPQIEALTWCVETPLKSPEPAPRQVRSATRRRPVRQRAGASRRALVAR